MGGMASRSPLAHRRRFGCHISSASDRTCPSCLRALAVVTWNSAVTRVGGPPGRDGPVCTIGMHMKPRSAEDVEGPWTDPQFDSGLIARCRKYWSSPVSEIPNAILATYLRQEIALELMIERARGYPWRGVHEKRGIRLVDTRRSV